MEAAGEWRTFEDRKFKGDAGEGETQQGQRASGVGVTRAGSHMLRRSAGDMLGLEGNGRS